MKWKEIKKKYPKGLDKLFAWLNIEEYDSTISKEVGTKWYQFEHGYLLSHEGFCWNKRNLYDFFDEQGIIIKIDVCPACDKYFFDVEIFSNTVHELIAITFESRKEAEQAAFLKAFEILENML